MASALTFPYTCPFDQTVHPDLASLYAHLKRFRVARAKFFHTYHPRKDRVNGELIPFTDVDQYFSQDFVSKETLREWLTKHRAEGLAWAKEWLMKRKESKGLVYAPSQVELRTLTCPSMPYYDTVGVSEGGYYGITEALGFAPRYYDELPVFHPALTKDAVVISDTREQAPLHLSIPTRNETLKVGDYALAAPHDLGIRIERKSLGDFCGTLSGRKVERKGGRKGTGRTEDCAFDRFDRELARAREQNLYVIMVVEADIIDAQRFDQLPQTQWVKASPAYVFHNLRELLTRHPLHFQVLFLNGRIEMAQTVVRLFQMGEQVRRVDLQHLHERGLL